MGSISLWHGDICELEVDAIVNAASTSLWMATGVAGAIKRRGGDSIEFEAVRQAPCPLGGAVVTGAGSLACQYVIHAVSLGPDRRASAASIESATRAAMAAAERLGVRSIAFPALGTGVGGFPLEEAAGAMVRAVREEIARRPSIEEVVFALKGQAPYVAFEAALALARPASAVPAATAPAFPAATASGLPGAAEEPHGSGAPGGPPAGAAAERGTPGTRAMAAGAGAVRAAVRVSAGRGRPPVAPAGLRALSPSRATDGVSRPGTRVRANSATR